MRKFEGTDGSNATPSLFNLCRHFQSCHLVRGDGESGNLRRRSDVYVLQLSIPGPEMRAINVVVDKVYIWMWVIMVEYWFSKK